MREPKLIALYHTAEHLMITDLEAGKESGITKRWRAKRNVLGFFDGRPLQILPPRPDGLAHDIPEDHTNLGTIKFLAHRLGELVFSASGKAVPFDISFDEEVGTNIP